MKATIRTGFFGTTFSFLKDYAKPLFDASSTSTNTNQVFIKVKSAGINPVDYKLPRFLSGSTVGIDFCGTIEEIGTFTGSDGSNGSVGSVDSSNKFQVGDDVFGTCKSGSLAEYCIADINKIAKVPTNWSYLECAALPVAFMSALQSLRIGKIQKQPPANDDDENSNVNTKKSVLIIGASGGCGIAGIQLCKAMGVGRIVGICSDRNIDFVKERGATEVVSYTNENELKAFFENNEGKFDCVYDAATNSGGGEDYWSMSLPLLKQQKDDGDDDGNDDGDDDDKHSGEFVALNGPIGKWVRALSGKQKDHESIMMMASNTEDLEMITSLLDKIEDKPVMNVMPFTEDGVADAFKLLKSRRTKGKIVLDLR